VTTRAQHQPCIVAQTVMSDALDEAATHRAVAHRFGCDRRTVGRWVAWVAALAEPATLSRRLVAESAVAVVPHPPVMVPRRRRSAARTAIGLRAVWVLALLEALASLLGLAPPGLAHAGRLVPALAPPTGGAAPAHSRG
jgi:transposase-like protein